MDLETGEEKVEAPQQSSEGRREISEGGRNAQEAPLSRTKSLENKVSLPREVLVVALISLAQLTTQIGLGQALAILHIIGDHFGVGQGTLPWLIAGYSLTVGTFILFSGRLGDLFGWKRMLVIGYVWFGTWSIIAGLAWYSNHVLFIFARVIGGIGPAISMPNAMALLGALYQPGKRKNMAFSSFAACAPSGSILGAVFASLFALAWWPWAFWSFGIFLFLVAVVAVFAIPDPQTRKPGIQDRSVAGTMRELDLLGATIGITGLILFNFAWNQAPIVGWQRPYIIVTLILGVLLIPAFIWIEIKISPNPLLPLGVFTSDNAFVLACVACGWATFGIWVFYLWQVLEVLRGVSPLLASAYACPIAISGAVAAATTGEVLGKLRPAWVMVIALSAFLVGTILVATVPVHQVYWAQIFVCTLVTPFGMDMSFPSSTLVVSNSVDKEHQGVAASLVNTIVNYSISLGLGFAGTVDVYTNSGQTPNDILQGYRAALYMGIGLAGLGLFVAITFLLKSYWTDHRKRHDIQRRHSPEREA